jgi:hypothetical protein
MAVTRGAAHDLAGHDLAGHGLARIGTSRYSKMAGISDRYLPVKNANGSASASNFAL